MTEMTSGREATQLCYLDAAQVGGPLPNFDGVDVRNFDDRKIGRLDGIIIDPTERQLRYLVVDEGGFFKHHRYLLPLAPTRVDAERHVLQVDVERSDLKSCEEFDPDAFRRFSDDDLIMALFADAPSRH